MSAHLALTDVPPMRLALTPREHTLASAIQDTKAMG